MADYDINANITANTKGYEAGINKVQKTTKSFSASLSKVIQGLGKNGLVGALGSIGLASAGLSATLGAVAKIAKQVSQAIGKCTEAYKVQLKAEQALDTAINNSPYITGSASKRLKEFASEMQKVSNLGDEEIIPQMTQLIATGRTEAETMKIIKTASDIASSGAMTFDTAVTQLNATLNGNVGRLGQQNAELKGLTEEELKSGRAVDILAEKYKGLTEATIDTKKQLQNAIGDLRESFGTVFEKALSPMRKFFAEIIQGWADARKAKQEYEGAVQAVASGNADIEQLQIVIDANEKKLEDFNKVVEQKAQEFKKTREEILKNWIMYLSPEEMEKYSTGDLFGPKQAEEIERQNYLLNSRIRLMNKLNEAEEKAKQKRAEGEEAEARRLERDKKTNKLKEEYLKKIAEQEAKWQHIKEVTGEQVSNEEKIKFYQDSLVDLMTQAGGQITTNNQLYKDQMAIIQSLVVEEEKGASALSEWEDKLLSQQLESLNVMKEIELEQGNGAKYEIETRYAKLMLEVQLKQLEREKEIALAKVEGTEEAEESRLKIIEYYAEQERLLRVGSSVKADKEIKNETKKTWKEIASTVTNIMKGVADKIGNMLKQVFSNIFSKIKGVGKIFDFNPDEALDNLLIFEDKVLTFFVETMPKLPQFIASAFESVATLLNTIFDNIDFENLLDGLVKAVITVLKNIPKLIIKAIPKVFKAIGTLFKEFRKLLPELLTVINGLIEELFKALPNFVQVELPAFLKDIASFIPTFMKAGSEFVKILVSALPNIVQTILDAFILLLQDPKAIADLAVSIIKAFVEVILVVVRNIGPLLKALLPAIATIIIEIFKALPELLWSLTKEIGSMILDVGKWIVNLIIDGINKMLDGISKVWTWIPGTKGIPHIPHFAKGSDNAPSGLALVGEAGPELVRFNGGEQVLNNRNTQKALAGMSNSGNTFNVTFNNLQDTSAYAMMSQLRQYNRQMAINGII